MMWPDVVVVSLLNTWCTSIGYLYATGYPLVQFYLSTTASCTLSEKLLTLWGCIFSQLLDRSYWASLEHHLTNDSSGLPVCGDSTPTPDRHCTAVVSCLVGNWNNPSEKEYCPSQLPHTNALVYSLNYTLIMLTCAEWALSDQFLLYHRYTTLAASQMSPAQLHSCAIHSYPLNW